MNSLSDIRNDLKRALSEFKHTYYYADVTVVGSSTLAVKVRVSRDTYASVDLYPPTRSKKFSSRRDRQKFYLKQMYAGSNLDFSDIDLSGMLYES